MVLHDLSEIERLQIQEEFSKKNPDISYLQILGVSAKDILKKTSVNVLDIVEKQAIKTNKEHFLQNMFQMIDNGKLNEKFNKKVRNFISKSNQELLELGLSPEDILKLRIKLGKKDFFRNILQIIGFSPIQIEEDFLLKYLFSISDFEKRKIGFEMSDIDILRGMFNRAKQKIINK